MIGPDSPVQSSGEMIAPRPGRLQGFLAGRFLIAADATPPNTIMYLFIIFLDSETHKKKHSRNEKRAEYTLFRAERNKMAASVCVRQGSCFSLFSTWPSSISATGKASQYDWLDSKKNLLIRSKSARSGPSPFFHEPSVFLLLTQLDGVADGAADQERRRGSSSSRNTSMLENKKMHTTKENHLVSPRWPSASSAAARPCGIKDGSSSLHGIYVLAT